MPGTFVIVEGPDACVDGQTELLTRRGWVRFRDATRHDDILTMDPETEEMVYLKPIRKIDKQYRGRMITFSGRNIDFAVTPDHQMFVKIKNRYILSPARNMSSSWTFKRDGIWRRPEVKAFMLQYNKRTVKFRMDRWLKFLGLFLGRGWVYVSERRAYLRFEGYSSRRGTREYLRAIPLRLRYLGVHDGGIVFELHDMAVYSYLRLLGDFKTRSLPSKYKNLPPHQLMVLLNAYLGNSRSRLWKAESKQLADDLHEILFKAGNGGYMKTVFRNGKVVYVLSAQRLFEPKVNMRKVRRRFYSGRVYCFTLPKYHLLYIRRNGKTMWIGNCGKTTIAETLQKEIGLEYKKFSNPRDEADGKKQYFGYFSTHTSGKYVLDRSHLGEWVYAPLFRNYTPKYWSEMEDLLRNVKAKILYLMPYASQRKFNSLPKVQKSQELEGKNTITLFPDIMKGFIDVYGKITYGDKVMFDLDTWSGLDAELEWLVKLTNKWLGGGDISQLRSHVLPEILKDRSNGYGVSKRYGQVLDLSGGEIIPGPGLRKGNGGS